MGDSASFTFKLPPVGGMYVGPSPLGAGVVEVVGGSGVALKFEYQTVDFGGAFGPGGAGEVRLGLPEVRSAKLEAGLFGGRFVVETTDPSVADGIPGGERGRLVLKVPRRERGAARRAESILAAGLRRAGDTA